jgi:hypothetical protein
VETTPAGPDLTALQVLFSVDGAVKTPHTTPASIGRAVGGTACAAYLLNPISTGRAADYEMFIQVPQAGVVAASAAVRAEAPAAVVTRTVRQVVPTVTTTKVNLNEAMSISC